jgi:NACHT domain
MPDQQTNRGPYEDVIMVIFGSVVSAAAFHPWLGAGKLAIVVPIACVIALSFSRSRAKRNSPTPDREKEALLATVSRRLDASLKQTSRSISEQFILSAEKWSGHDALFPSSEVLENGLIQDFDETGSLLVLGRPGMGKTLLLLQLAKSLVKRCDPTKQHPVPVVLSLSSWLSSADFKQWLIAEVKSDYLVPQETATSLVERDGLILLLDGLDEIAPAHRSSCITAINEYQTSSRVPGIVVCSRQAEYEAIGLDLDLVQTILLLPLRDQQIYDHLVKAGDNREPLERVLKTNGELRELARSPLMLNVFTEIADRIDEIVNTGSPVLPNENYLKRVFNLFIRNQLDQKRPQPLEFGPRKVLSCLSWLAAAKTQTAFFIEQLQPSWLGRLSGKGKWLLVLYTLVSRITGTTAIMLVGVTMMYVCQGVASVFSGNEANPYGLIHVEKDLGRWFLITTVFGGFTMFVVDMYRFLASSKNSAPTRGRWKYQLASIAVNVGICTTVFLIVSRFFAVSNRLYGSLMYGSALGMVLWFRGQGLELSNDIRIAERLIWSWNKFWRGLLWGALGGVLIGPISGLLAWWLSGATTSLNVAALAFIAATLIGGTVNGLQRSGEIEQSAVANRGIRISARNAFKATVSVTIPFTVVFWLYGIFATGSLTAILESGMFFAVVVGIIVGFSYGGLDVLYHYVLRPFLWLDGFRVIRYERFLECAAKLNFLRRSEGTYEFFHPSIAVHFAALAPSDISELIAKRGGRPIPPSSVPATLTNSI